jgi:GNAT superfamily N-acetyltransferase
MVTPEWSDWRAGTWWWIQSVYVRPELRGRGIFRALYEHVRRRVEADRSLVGLRLYAARGNRAARQVYEHLGMAGGHYDMLEWSQ